MRVNRELQANIKRSVPTNYRQQITKLRSENKMTDDIELRQQMEEVQRFRELSNENAISELIDAQVVN